MECAGCDGCRFATGDKLYADVDGRHYCAECWKKAGKPWPRNFPTDRQLQEAETETRKRMIRRGGEDRYRALSGKA